LEHRRDKDVRQAWAAEEELWVLGFQKHARDSHQNIMMTSKKNQQESTEEGKPKKAERI